MGLLSSSVRNLALAPTTLLLAGLAVLVGLAYLLTPNWPPEAACYTHGCEEAREWIASSITFLAILGGLFQYWRAQQWKRTEFLAQEMKDFFGGRKIQNALTMMDWGRRKVDLFNDQEHPERWPTVTRKMQSHALYLHPLTQIVTNEANAESQEDEDEEGTPLDTELPGFTREEAAIRDAYDAFLDGLERFASYLTTGLVAATDLSPYLRYWMDEIPKKGKPSENDFTCLLLSYICFYNYSGVQQLLRTFGNDIAYGSELFEFYLNHFRDKALAAKIRSQLEKELLRRASGGHAPA
jgi:hypothetical protein